MDFLLVVVIVGAVALWLGFRLFRFFQGASKPAAKGAPPCAAGCPACSEETMQNGSAPCADLTNAADALLKESKQPRTEV